MSDASDALVLSRPPLPGTAEPIRVAVRRLRWFRSALLHQLDVLSDQTGVTYQIDDRRLAAAFVMWLRKVEEQKPEHSAHRKAYFDFAAGLMLHELLSKEPIRADVPSDMRRRKGPEYSWPEGFACTVFCINMLSAVRAQEYDEATEVSPDFLDTRVWDSFHENVQEQATRAIGYLHMFVGSQPNWLTLTLVHQRFAGPRVFESQGARGMAIRLDLAKQFEGP